MAVPNGAGGHLDLSFVQSTCGGSSGEVTIVRARAPTFDAH